MAIERIAVHEAGRMISMTSNVKLDPIPDDWKAPLIHKAEVMDCGRSIGMLIRHRDGSVAAVRIAVDEIERMVAG